MELLTLGNDIEVKANPDGLVSLSDLWKSSGLGHEKKPTYWMHHYGNSFIDVLSAKLGNPNIKVYESIKGRYGGIYAHPQAALAYAKWLSPEFHLKVNEIFTRYHSGDITLADEIADKASPQDQKWLEQRMRGKIARLEFTGALSNHGVSKAGYGLCTNGIYKPILGMDAKQAKATHNITKPSQNLRDHLSRKDLAAIELAEIVAAEKMDNEQSEGNEDCFMICHAAASKIKQAIA